MIKKRQLRFVRYENVTQPGQDGYVIQFLFSVMGSSIVGTSEELQVTTWHRLRVGVAGGIGWGNDETFLARVLFSVGKRDVAGKLCLQGDLLELETVFVPHGDCPVDPEGLMEPDGVIVEVEIS